MLPTVIFINLLCFISRWNPGHGIPQDLKPNLFVSSKKTENLPSFVGQSGSDTGFLDLQEIKIIDGRILIGSRNAAFVVSQSSFSQATGNIPYDQMILWNSADKSRCVKQRDRERCNNFIRVISLVDSDQMLLCGTNAGKQRCRKYGWNGLELSNSYTNISSVEQFLVPISDEDSIAYLFTDNYTYTATTLNFNKQRTLIRTQLTDNTPQNSTHNDLPRLITKQDPSGLKNPEFIGIIENKDHVFLFLKEEAIEASDQTEKMIFSRVAQACKHDVGGNRNTLNQRWTSFFKARLNCSLPGNRPFYFNEIQHISGPIKFDGKSTIFATFTTPENHLPGSAVCAFSLEGIKETMNRTFLEHDRGGSCGRISVPGPPSITPDSCHAIKDDDTLRFIKSHQLMFESVPAIDSKPIFTLLQTNERFTSIAVETISVNGIIANVLYIGTHNGSLLKVTTNQKNSNQNNLEKIERKVSFNEKWQVYQPKECGKPGSSRSEEEEEKKVRNITLIDDFILVSFKSCVISVPKKACWFYTCESSCVQSGNPYCGWKSGLCVPINDGDEMKQDLFAEETYDQSCSGDIGNPSCEGSVSVSLFIIVLIANFLLFLLIVVVLLYKTRRKHIPYSSKQRNNQKKPQNSFSTKFFKRSSAKKTNNVKVELSTPIQPSIYERGRPPLNINNSNRNCTMKHFADQYLSSDDTTWSEDLSWDDSFATNYNQKCDLPNGGKDFSDCKSINNPHEFQSSLLSRNNKNDHYPGPHHNERFGDILVHSSTFAERTRHLKQSRILTNPRHVPVNSCVTRPVDQSKHNNATSSNNDFQTKVSKMITFFPQNLKSKPVTTQEKEHLELQLNSTSSKLFSLEYKNLDQNLSPSEDLSSFASTDIPNAHGHVYDFDKALSSPNTVASSSPDRSTSSGFVSCSPQDQSTSEAVSSRKAFIVAKGILSAQSSLASCEVKNKRRRRKQKHLKKGTKEDKCDSVSEASTFAEKICDSLLTSSDVSSNTNDDNDSLFSFPNPEFAKFSDEEDDEPADSSQIVNKNSTLPFLKQCERKKSTSVFTTLKMKRGKIKELNDDDFMSPAYDEELFVPKIEGWQEIDYTTTTMTSQSHSNLQNALNFGVNENRSDTNPDDKFCTIRPYKRSRSKASTTRSVEKNWDSRSLHLLPVPTPEVPVLD